MNRPHCRSLLAAFSFALLVVLGTSGCGTAHQAVDKSGRVLEHGARKVERHLPE